jgi:hypothetical protein
MAYYRVTVRDNRLMEYLVQISDVQIESTMEEHNMTEQEAVENILESMENLEAESEDTHTLDSYWVIESAERDEEIEE